jgi:hypothetical protein
MIRQAINCDICASEKQASNYWFVAYEQGGELKLCAWESPKNSRKNAKHLCGQKCAQRMVANYMTSLMAAIHQDEQGKEAALSAEMMPAATMPVEAPDRTVRLATAQSGRAVIDDDAIEAESWAGPVRAKEDTWETLSKLRAERESFLNATRGKTPAPSRLQRMA